MEDRLSKRARVEGPGAEAIPAEQAITFHLLKKDAEGQVVLEENGNFPPDMTHQLFGEQEEIVGYDGLSIDVWLTPQFKAFVDVKYAAKGPGATPLKEPFEEAFPAGFFQDKATFDRALQEEPPLELGIFGKEASCKPAGDGISVKIFSAQLSTATADLRALHARMQPLLYFFVDGASAIDADDPDWYLLTAVASSAEEGPEVLGFATVYRYWHYPAGCRLRLAQILVLPPHQGCGVGAGLLQAVQRLAEEMGAVDVAFEEPAEGLQALRTRLDVGRALALEWVHDAVAQGIAAQAAAAEQQSNGKGKAAANGAANGAASSRAARAAAASHPLAPPPGLLDRLRRELRLSKLQAAVVWRVALLVGGKGQDTVRSGVESLILQELLVQAAEAKGDSQGKSVLETEKGFVMCRGANPAKSTLPLLPVEEQSAEQQAEAVEEAAAAALEAAAAVAQKFLVKLEQQ